MELDDHLFIEKQSEEQQWSGVPYLRGRCCCWKAKELRDTNCQEAKCHLVDDQVVLTGALGNRTSAWPLFSLYNINPPDPESKCAVGRRVKYREGSKWPFQAGSAWNRKFRVFLLKWRLIFHTGQGPLTWPFWGEQYHFSRPGTFTQPCVNSGEYGFSEILY